MSKNKNLSDNDFQIIKKLSKEQKAYVIRQLRRSSYRRIFKKDFISALFDCRQDFEKFAKRWKKHLSRIGVDMSRVPTIDNDETIKLALLDEDEINNSIEELTDSEETWSDEDWQDEDSELVHNLSHDKKYYYNEVTHQYIVQLPSQNTPFIMPKQLWDSFIEAYSNWAGSAHTISQMCRKFHLSRTVVKELINAMEITHDSSPFSEETLAKTEKGELVESLLRKKEDEVFVKYQQKEQRKLEQDAKKYRDYMRFVDSIRIEMEKTPCLAIPKSELETKKLKPSLSPYSVVLSPSDFHWGKYASIITGDPYNRKIAKERLFRTSKDLMDRIEIRGKPEKIFLAIGGDGLHIDNQQKRTTRGTPQDCDGVPSELASSYVRLCTEYIEFLRLYGIDIEVYIIAGNHDFYSTALLREAIRAWFRKESDVQVVDSLNTRQTFAYGDSMITFMHGDVGKVKDYPAIIANENPTIFGFTKQRFIFTGHLHTERELPTFGNWTVYRMPSLAGTDDWHWNMGYKSRKALIAYLVDKRLGVIATEISPC